MPISKDFFRKMPKTFGTSTYLLIFALRNLCFGTRLGYGVTVALQILILSVLVRIQVTQQKQKKPLQFAEAFFIGGIGRRGL